jgi:hypothetical protein
MLAEDDHGMQRIILREIACRKAIPSLHPAKGIRRGLLKRVTEWTPLGHPYLSEHGLLLTSLKGSACPELIEQGGLATDPVAYLDHLLVQKRGVFFPYP